MSPMSDRSAQVAARVRAELARRSRLATPRERLTDPATLTVAFLLIVALAASWAALNRLPPPASPPVATAPAATSPTESPTAQPAPAPAELPDTGTIQHAASPGFSSPDVDCTSYLTGPTVPPRYAGCVIRGEYHDLPGVTGRLHAAVLSPPADLTVDPDWRQPRVAAAWQPGSPYARAIDWVMQSCAGDWHNIADSFPGAVEAARCHETTGTAPVFAALVQVAAATPEFLVFVHLVAHLPPEADCPEQECGPDPDQLVRHATELAEHLLAEA